MWELALGLTVSLASDSTAACTRMIFFGSRPAHETSLTLRATRDSVSDDRLPPPSGEPGRRYIVDAARERVFGQVFTVITATGRDAQYWEKQHSVILIWWLLGAACTHHPPQAALHPRIKDLFLATHPSLAPSVLSPSGPGRILAAELRPPEYWVAGLPTVDVQWDVWRYSPELPQVQGTPDFGLPNMTVAEYAEVHRYLPEGWTQAGDTAVARRLLAAGATRPRWWRQYPALGFLCTAWKSVRDGPRATRAFAAAKCT